MKNTFTFAFSIAIISLFFVGCSNEDQVQKEVELENKKQAQQITGSWESNTLEITLQTVSGTDSTATRIYTKENWTEKMGIKPVITVLNADGTFVQDHKDITDLVIEKFNGNWKVSKDTLFLMHNSPDSRILIYNFKINSDSLILSTVLDYDHDGEIDDLYNEVQTKIK